MLTNGDQIFPRDARGDPGARSAGSASKPTSTTRARSPTSSPRRSKRRRGAAFSVNWWSIRSAPAAMKDDDVKRLKAAGCTHRQFNSPNVVLRSKRSTTARTARFSSSTARSGSPAASGVADHWLGHAQDKEHWRDTQVRMRGPIVRLRRGGLLRELHRDRRRWSTPELDDLCARSSDERRRIARRCAARRPAAATI